MCQSLFSDPLENDPSKEGERREGKEGRKELGTS